MGNCTVTTPSTQNCELFQPWEDCSSCGDKEAYDAGESATYCIDGTKFVAISLVDGNTDKPWLGASKSPPTWKTGTMTDYLNQLMAMDGGTPATEVTLDQLRAVNFNTLPLCA